MASSTDPFFQLDSPWDEIATAQELSRHLNRSNDLRNVLYRPNSFSGPPHKIRGVTFENVSLSKTTIKDVTFHDCVFRDCLFVGTRFVGVEFHKCKFVRCNPHKSRFSRCYIDPRVFSRLLDPRIHANIGAYLFNQLERNAKEQEQHEFRDHAAFLYRRWKRYQWNWLYRAGHIGRAKWFIRWVPDIAYSSIAGYGWRSSRFIISSAILFLVAATVNFYFWNDLGMVMTHEKHGPVFLKSAYFTIVTFATVGYGDITPTTATGLAVASAEALIGLLWLTILASVLFRKVFR